MRTRSPGQIVSFGLGVWWVLNGLGALLVDSNFATGAVHGQGELFGIGAITANGWHALFHLVPGLLGIAAARRPRPALAFLLSAGTIYVAVGVWGLVAGGNAVSVIAVDEPGDVVHMAEGLIALVAGLLIVGVEAMTSRSASDRGLAQPELLEHVSAVEVEVVADDAAVPRAD